jgi:type I restriction enzyme, S subunit
MTYDNNKLELKPKLRFPDFQDDGFWVNKPLHEICDRIVDKVGDAKLTTVSITAGRGFVSQAEKFGRNISGAQYKNYIYLQRGDFAYNKGNSNVYPQGCVYRLKEFDQAAASNAFICFRLKPGFAPGFIEGLFQKNTHGRQLVRFLTSGARSDGLLNIRPDEFFRVALPIPPRLAEQQKIADCFSSLDELIAAHTRTLDELKVYKHGLMQQLFPREGETLPRLRFPEFEAAGEWKEKNLEDLAKRGSGHTPNKGKKEYYNGRIKWVSLADSKRLDNGFISDTEIEISDLGIQHSSAVLHPAGSVILSRDAGVGKSAIMGVSMAVSQHFIVWTCDSHQLSNWFLYYILQKRKPLFERVASGSTIKTIGLPFFTEMRVIVPRLPEQQRIADSLSSLDDLIAAQTQKLGVLRTHKKGLMQQLFPSPTEVEA